MTRCHDFRRAIARTVLPGLLLGLAATLAPTQPTSVVQEYRLGAAAVEKKDYPRAIEHLSRALAGAPAHPGLMAELARAEALAGRPGPALARLATALKLGGGLDIVSDPAVATLLARDDAAGVREAAASLQSAVATSREAFRIPQRDLIPEGLAYDPGSKSFFVGSIYRRKILRVDRAGRVSEFVPEARDGLLAVLGMKVDRARRSLWAATEGTLNMRGGTARDVGRSALRRYDLGSGRLLETLEPPSGPGPHLFNDLVVDRDGGVFVTDSEEGSIWRRRVGAGRLERLAGPHALVYPNGIALSSDETRLFVAHLAGVAVFDLTTGRTSALPHPESVTLADIDGLYRDGHRLVAIQNGLSPARVALFELTPEEDRVVGVRVLERGHPLFAAIPTTGAVADGMFYYIANAQLRAFDRDNRILPEEKLQETVILRTPLAAASDGGRF